MRIDMDKMVSIKGLVIRTTPVIPDMKTGKNHDNNVSIVDTKDHTQHSSVVKFAITP